MSFNKQHSKHDKKIHVLNCNNKFRIESCTYLYDWLVINKYMSVWQINSLKYMSACQQIHSQMTTNTCLHVSPFGLQPSKVLMIWSSVVLSTWASARRAREGNTEQAHCHRVSVNNKLARLSTYIGKIWSIVNFRYPTDNPRWDLISKSIPTLPWVGYGSNPRVKKHIRIRICRIGYPTDIQIRGLNCHPYTCRYL
jgi:hypothetical protein